jgi:hypothetical protein
LQGSFPDQENLHPPIKKETGRMSLVVIQSEEDIEALRKSAQRERKNLEQEVADAKGLWTNAVEIQGSNLTVTEQEDLMSFAERNLSQKLRKQQEYVNCWARFL